jgi:hypothetical protein
MDLSECTSLELWEFVEGHAAARNGEPFNPYQTEYWVGGFRFWFQSAPEREAELDRLRTLH